MILRKETEGFWAQIVELSGCFSQGKNKEETRDNIKEVIEGYHETFPEEPTEPADNSYICHMLYG